MMIDRDDLDLWLEDQVTKIVFMKLKEEFDFTKALMGAENGQTIDRFKGRAEVLDYLANIRERI